MIPIRFEQANTVHTKPVSMTDEQCGDLHTCVTKDSNGLPVIVSCWEISKEELEEIQKTGKIYLVMYSGVQPPVNLMIRSPFI